MMRAFQPQVHIESEVWNLPKFVVAIGMMLLLLEDQIEHNKHLALHDPLTGLPNRRLFEDRMAISLERSRRTGTEMALLVIDLNDFKQVNDNYGHRTGDIYLQQVAARMKHQLRPGDVLARLGGDEFAVLIQNVRNRAAAGEVAQRLEHCFNELFVCEEVVLRGSASIGIAMYPTDGNTKDSLLSAADASMYVVKQTRAS